MPWLLKIRVDRPDADFTSMLDEGPAVSERTEWGTVGVGANYRAAGDVRAFSDGLVRVGDLVLVRERQTAARVYFVALLRIERIDHVGGDYTPWYEAVERFDGSPTLDQLKVADPAIAALPHFQKNAKGMMLRAFTPLTDAELDTILTALRASRPA